MNRACPFGRLRNAVSVYFSMRKCEAGGPATVRHVFGEKCVRDFPDRLAAARTQARIATMPVEGSASEGRIASLLHLRAQPSDGSPATSCDSSAISSGVSVTHASSFAYFSTFFFDRRARNSIGRGLQVLLKVAAPFAFAPALDFAGL